MDSTRFMELDCIRLQNGALELLVTQTVGPRIIRLSLLGAENILAELPHAQLECPDIGTLHLRGGHRLWHAPEMRRRTYLPDNQPPEIVEVAGGVRVSQPTEPQTGIQKSMQITLPDDSATVVIDHTLRNEGLWPVELAPWAISQIKPGGTGILPQISGNADPDGLLPNRPLALWPYTDINSPHIQWGNRYIFVRATMSQGALKIGFPNPAGWLGYYLERTLFVKQAVYRPEATYFDFGSSSECYCCPDFIELETIAPRTRLAPGESVSHRETWRIFGEVSLDLSEAGVQRLAERLGL
jgi:hypothetical protein